MTDAEVRFYRLRKEYYEKFGVNIGICVTYQRPLEEFCDEIETAIKTGIPIDEGEDDPNIVY